MKFCRLEKVSTLSYAYWMLKFYTLDKISLATETNATTHCKNIRRVYGKIHGMWLPVHFPLFLRASTRRTFLKQRYGRVMITDSTQKHFCRV